VAQHVVLTAIGEDRPGLVEEVSEFVFECGGSIEDSRMENLRGQFAIAMLIGGSDEAIERIAAEIDALRDRTGIRTQLARVAAADTSGAARSTYRLTGRALDQAGLVHQLANLLRTLGVNIESMDTTLEPAPHTGAPMFAIDVVVAVPDDADVEEIRAELGRVCDTLGIDWQLAPL